MASINDLATAATAAMASSAGALAPEPAAAPAPAGAPGTAPPIPPAAAADATPARPGPSAGAEQQQQRPARGALVVLEGLDRSGKTTQVKLLEQRFVEAGKKVKVMRFPDRTSPIGQMIDAYLKSQLPMDDHAIHLLFSANRWEAARAMSALLASGTTVLCDRYYHSGVVYSAAKRNPALSLAWARAPEVGLPRPDLVLFLDLDEAQARGRGGWGAEVYERAETQRRVRELFWGLSMGSVGGGGADAGADAADGGARFRQEEEDLMVVDAGPSVEEVAEEIWKLVRPRVESVERGEVGSTVRVVS